MCTSRKWQIEEAKRKRKAEARELTLEEWDITEVATEIRYDFVEKAEQKRLEKARTIDKPFPPKNPQLRKIDEQCKLMM